ncbi:hypothetical protein STSP2_01650 [Anaerohalosphaera lusitana]|uniref:DUF3352 domain-containing protein n=1 Tax=Anaerohalosphaera lusitana TaxID=1936003 RepID=A0A1U9NLX2_9BACT|nr:hypothetical protein [Anaerohalosphaera lusitana]AQT68486.1 hypothetical protein STSP2_01650 [Anaerohalosphaera lusitana]
MKKAMICLVLALTAGYTIAGPVNLHLINNDAKWAMHLDLAKARQTVAGKLLSLKADSKYPEEASEAVTEFEKYAGQGAAKLVEGITIFSTSEKPRSGIAILSGRLDQQFIDQQLKSEGLELTKYDGKNLYTKQNEDKGGVAFANKDLIVLGSDIEMLKRALDAISGKTPNAGSGDGLPALRNWEQGTFFGLDFDDLTPMRNVKPDADFLKSPEQMSFSAGEADGKLSLWANVRTPDPQRAMKIKQIAQGLVALAAIKTSELPELADMVESVQVWSQGSNVSASFDYPAQKLVELAAKYVTMHQEKIDCQIELSVEVEPKKPDEGSETNNE